MAEKRITLHPTKSDGTLDTDTNLYPKTTPVQVLFSDEQRDALGSGITAPKVTKLEGIEAGAQVNKIETIKVNNEPVTISNKTVNITIDYFVEVTSTTKVSEMVGTHYIRYNSLFYICGVRKWNSNYYSVDLILLDGADNLERYATEEARGTDTLASFISNDYIHVIANAVDLQNFLPLSGGNLEGSLNAPALIVDDNLDASLRLRQLNYTDNFARLHVYGGGNNVPPTWAITFDDETNPFQVKSDGSVVCSYLVPYSDDAKKITIPNANGTLATQEWANSTFVVPATLNNYQPLDSDLTAIAGITGAGLLKRNSQGTWDLVSQADLISNCQPKDDDLTAIAGLTGTTGFLKKTAANTWALDATSYLPITGGTLSGNTGIDFNEKGTIRSRSGGGLELYSGTANYRYFFPATDNAYVMGGDTSRWYYVNTVRLKNSTTATTKYLLIPETTSWTSDRTIATIDDIREQEYVSSITFENDGEIYGGSDWQQGDLLMMVNTLNIGSKTNGCAHITYGSNNEDAVIIGNDNTQGIKITDDELTFQGERVVVDSDIKTINNASLLGGGNLTVGNMTLYKHEIYHSGSSIYLVIISTNSEASNPEDCQGIFEAYTRTGVINAFVYNTSSKARPSILDVDIGQGAIDFYYMSSSGSIAILDFDDRGTIIWNTTTI